MQIAIVGCGFVADLYAATLRAHPQLQVTGVFDRDAERAARFASHYGYPLCTSLDEILGDPRVSIVANLTNPSSHFDVSHAALLAGKHVYSEKPLATRLDQAAELVEVAESRGLQLSSAPCSLLGETAQTIWKALRESVVGPVRVVYAELDDGPVHQMPYRQWLSASGTPWPWKDEFEVGCTLEHAGYYVTWLVAFFGPVESVTAFASCQVPGKRTDAPLDVDAPDFSVACLRFASGVVARLTCGIVAPHDHALRIVGDTGVMHTADCWRYQSPVRVRRMARIRRKVFLSPWSRRIGLVKSPYAKVRRRGAAQMDFARGLAEMADAISNSRPPRLSARFALHVNEVVLAIHNSAKSPGLYHCTTTCEPVAPMDWAK